MIAGFFGHAALCINFPSARASRAKIAHSFVAAALTPSTYAQYAVGASVGLRRALHQFSLREGIRIWHSGRGAKLRTHNSTNQKSSLSVDFRSFV